MRDQASGISANQNVMCASRQGTTVRERTVYQASSGMYLPREEGARCCVSQ